MWKISSLVWIIRNFVRLSSCFYSPLFYINSLFFCVFVSVSEWVSWCTFNLDSSCHFQVSRFKHVRQFKFSHRKTHPAVTFQVAPCFILNEKFTYTKLCMNIFIFFFFHLKLNIRLIIWITVRRFSRSW